MSSSPSQAKHVLPVQFTATDSPVVTLRYPDLLRSDVDLSASIAAAYGDNGLGLLVLSDIPSYPALRSNLLPLASRFARLPPHIQHRYESPESFYSFGWSLGKETFNNKPDRCFATGTILRRYNGEKIPVERVTAGELLMGDDGLPRIVSAGSLTHGRAVLYRVTPTRCGAKAFTVNGAHILVLTNIVRPHRISAGAGWSVEWFDIDTTNQMQHCMTRFDAEAEAEAELRDQSQRWMPLVWEVSVDDFLLTPAHIRDRCQLMQSGPVTFQSPLPSLHHTLSLILGITASTAQVEWVAWYLGMWISAGCMSSDGFNQPAAQSAITERVLEYQRLFGETVQLISSQTTTAGYSFQFGAASIPSIALRVLSAYNLLSRKHIPHAWICDTLHVRRRIIAGMIDGGRQQQQDLNSFYTIHTDHCEVEDGLTVLAGSLGLRDIRDVCTSTCGAGAEDGHYCIVLSGNMRDVVQYCAEYQSAGADCAEYGAEESARCYDFTISKQAEGDYYGFAVHGGVNRRFLLADFTITHNSKGSYYANPVYDDPYAGDEEMVRRYPSFAMRNIWPTADVPELEGALKALGGLIVQIGAVLSRHIDEFIAQRLPSYPPHHLQSVVESSRNHKARLLHYFPLSADNQDDTAVDSHCGYHNDHGSLTGLTSAQWTDEATDTILPSSPDPTAGLYIVDRSGRSLHVTIPTHSLAFQLGECQMIHSGGLVQATPHAVKASPLPQLSRQTFAVFMEPSPLASMRLPAGIDRAQLLSAPALSNLPAAVPRMDRRFDPADNFGEFSRKTLEGYYPAQQNSGVRVHSDIAYVSDGAAVACKAHARELDLYLPSLSSVSVCPPLVVFVHGGLWMDRDKSDYGNIGRCFAGKGLAVAVINYRQTAHDDNDPTSVIHPQHTLDLATAVIALTSPPPSSPLYSLSSHSSSSGYDTRRVILFGHSCGAHMIAHCVSSSRFLPPSGRSAIIGCIGCEGLYDVKGYAAANPEWSNELLRVFREGWDDPLCHSGGGEENVWKGAGWLVLHSRDDMWVKAEQADDWIERLRLRGVAATKVEIGGGHFEVVERIGGDKDEVTDHIWSFLQPLVA